MISPVVTGIQKERETHMPFLGSRTLSSSRQGMPRSLWTSFSPTIDNVATVSDLALNADTPSFEAFAYDGIKLHFAGQISRQPEVSVQRSTWS